MEKFIRKEGKEEKNLGKMESCLNEFTHVVKREIYRNCENNVISQKKMI